jgi:hypothetical protein
MIIQNKDQQASNENIVQDMIFVPGCPHENLITDFGIIWYTLLRSFSINAINNYTDCQRKTTVKLLKTGVE